MTASRPASSVHTGQAIAPGSAAWNVMRKPSSVRLATTSNFCCRSRQWASILVARILSAIPPSTAARDKWNWRPPPIRAVTASVAGSTATRQSPRSMVNGAPQAANCKIAPDTIVAMPRAALALLTLLFTGCNAFHHTVRADAPQSWFRITLGLTDTAPADWSGSIQATGGRLTALHSVRFDNDDKLDTAAGSWTCHTRRATVADPRDWFVGAKHIVPTGAPA